MSAIKIICLMLFICRANILLAEFYQMEISHVNTTSAYQLIPSSTKVTCVLACAQDKACKGNGLDLNHTCYLFDKEYAKEQSGDGNETMIIFKALQGEQLLH